MEILSAFTQHARQVLWRTLSDLICASLSASRYPLLSSPPSFLPSFPFSRSRTYEKKLDERRHLNWSRSTDPSDPSSGSRKKKRNPEFFPLLSIRSRDRERILDSWMSKLLDGCSLKFLGRDWKSFLEEETGWRNCWKSALYNTIGIISLYILYKPLIN